MNRDPVNNDTELLAAWLEVAKRMPEEDRGVVITLCSQAAKEGFERGLLVGAVAVGFVAILAVWLP